MAMDKIKTEIIEKDHEKPADLVVSEAIEKMVEISSHPSLFTKFSFGKYKDKTLEEVAKTDKRYLEWLLNEKLKNEAGDEDWIYTLKHYLGKLF